MKVSEAARRMEEALSKAEKLSGMEKQEAEMLARHYFKQVLDSSINEIKLSPHQQGMIGFISDSWSWNEEEENFYL